MRLKGEDKIASMDIIPAAKRKELEMVTEANPSRQLFFVILDVQVLLLLNWAGHHLRLWFGWLVIIASCYPDPLTLQESVCLNCLGVVTLGIHFINLKLDVLMYLVWLLAW